MIVQAAPIARYQAVKQHIMGLIYDGTLLVGDRVPSENELVKVLGISRMTVNRAFKELTEENHITRRAGLGSFVAEKRVHGEALKVANIRDELKARGETWSATVLIAEMVKVSTYVAAEMIVPSGARLFRLKVVHKGDGVPIEIEDRIINPSIAPGIEEVDFTQITSAEFLLSVAPLLKAEHVIRAIAASPDAATLLDISEKDPCLMVQRRTWTGDMVASAANLTYPGNRYELTARFSSNK